MQNQSAAALSPSPDRSASTPSPLPPMSVSGCLPKGGTGKDYHPANQLPPASFGGGKRASNKSTATSTVTSSMGIDQHQQHQLATITLTPMSTLTGTAPSVPGGGSKKDARVSSPFGGTGQRVASPSPILTITPSEGPMPPARGKEPAGSRKIKGKKATGQQARPTPYSRPTVSQQHTIPQLGVPGLSIEPVLGPLIQPMSSKTSAASSTSVGRMDKTATVGMAGANVPKDLLASYTELLQKYPHMARSLLMSMKGNQSTAAPPPPMPSSSAGTAPQQSGGRKQSTKQSNKASTNMAMQAAMAGMLASNTAATTSGNRFGASTAAMPRISATITPVPSATGGFSSADTYSRQTSVISGGVGGRSSPAVPPSHTMGAGQQQAKTLQQKLAERQKANKARETEGAGPSAPKSNRPPDDPDVIVLE